MTDDSAPEAVANGPHDDQRDAYQAPTIQRLGTLAELTQGGAVGPDDGLGGAADASI